MTITLELASETEASLLAQAKARGLSLDAFVKTIVDEQAAANGSKGLMTGFLPQGEASDRVIDELFDSSDVPPGVGEGSMSRENWYR